MLACSLNTRKQLLPKSKIMARNTLRRGLRTMALILVLTVSFYLLLRAVNVVALSTPLKLRGDYKKLSKLKIPHIIHQTWKSDLVPSYTVPWITSWRRHHPDWQIWFWNDSDVSMYISKKYPQYLELFNSYATQIQRIDAARLIILYEFGGIYADLDVECLRPLDKLFRKYDCVIGQEPELHSYVYHKLDYLLPSNAIMAVAPGHPFMKFLVENLKFYHENVSRELKDEAMETTGPFMLAKAIRYYNSLTVNKRFPVKRAVPDMFLPTFADEHMASFKSTCMHYKHMKQSPIRGACAKFVKENFVNRPKAYSFTDHHWTHSWIHTPAEDQVTYAQSKSVRIQTIVPDVLRPKF